MNRRPVVVTLTLLAALSLAANGYLILRGRAAKPANSAAPASVGPRPVLARGMAAPVLQGRDLSGNVVNVDYKTAGKPTVLYVITPGCIWCTRNEASFATLVRERAGAYNFILVSLAESGFRQYHRRIRGQWGAAGVGVMMNLPETTRTALRLGNTPHTIVISPEAKVLESWEGAYTLNRQSTIENYFLVRLPGVVLNEKARAF